MATWAVIKTGGKQYKVAEGDNVEVERLARDKEGKVTFNKVMLIAKDNKLTLGRPYVQKAMVQAKVLGDFKDKKIRVVKFKSKSRYLRQAGYRHLKTRINIERILPAS